MLNYSVLITSCDRHDLLAQTINSFIENMNIRPQETIIVEDGSAPAPNWINAGHMENMGKRTWLNNWARRGQLHSADRLWEVCSNDLAFWMEDDWRFLSSGFMERSQEIIENYPEVFTVSMRGTALTDWHPLIDDPRFPFKILQPGYSWGWGGFTFNCGLRRKADYLKLGTPYAKYVVQTNSPSFELEMSKRHVELGYVIPDIGKYVEHTGVGHSCYKG
jgi:hypothetical protein